MKTKTTNQTKKFNKTPPDCSGAMSPRPYTKAELKRLAIRAEGHRAGYEQGLHDGRQQMTNQEKKFEASVKLINAAGQMQECITKLVMSINNHL